MNSAWSGRGRFVKTKELLKALHEEDGWGYVNEST